MQGARTRVVFLRRRLAGRRCSRSRTGPCATSGSCLAASRTSRGGRSWPRTRLRGGRADEAAFARAADIELAAARPLRDNAYKVPLARNAASSRRWATWRACDGTVSSHAESARREPHRGARQGHRRWPVTPTSTEPDDRRPTLRPCTSTVARGAHRPRSTPPPALALDGVFAVLSHENAPRLDEPPTASCRAAVAAHRLPRPDRRGRGRRDASRRRREAAAACASRYDEERARRASSSPTTRALYKPAKVNAGFETDTEAGDVDAALTAAEIGVDADLRDAGLPQQPDGAARDIAMWEADGGLTLLRLDPGLVRRRAARSPGFRARAGAGARDRASTSAAASAPRARRGRTCASPRWRRARRPRRSSSRSTRQQMFALTGYRTPTIQRLQPRRRARWPARPRSPTTSSSRPRPSTSSPSRPRVVTRMMYAAPRPPHDAPAGARSMCRRRPGCGRPASAPGMFALESAIDELAVALRHRPDRAARRATSPRSIPRPASRSRRNLVACLREGARALRLGRPRPAPGARRDGVWLVGTGVAAVHLPGAAQPLAGDRAPRGGRHVHRTGCRRRHRHRCAHRPDADRGRRAGRRADAGPRRDRRLLAAEGARRRRLDGDGRPGARPSSRPARQLRARIRRVPPRRRRRHRPRTSTGDAPLPRHGFGAHFAEVRVNSATGEIRVPRMLGRVRRRATSSTRKTARSQFIGGMTMGIGMALLEESIMDREFGDYVNHDLAELPRAAYADIERHRRDLARRGGRRSSTRWAPRASARSTESSPAVCGLAQRSARLPGANADSLPIRHE